MSVEIHAHHRFELHAATAVRIAMVAALLTVSVLKLVPVVADWPAQLAIAVVVGGAAVIVAKVIERLS